MPTQMTGAQARVIDPILTNVARGWKNGSMVGSRLFPTVPVQQRGGKIVAFRKEDFQLYSTGRAPGAATRRISFGYDSASYALESHSLEGTVPIELLQEANAVPGIDLARIAINKTQNIIGLRLEKAQADLALTAANYGAANKITLSGTGQWSDLTNSDPISDVETGKEAVRQLIGLRPNVMIIGPTVFKSLKQHGKILDRIKYTGRDVPTVELLSALFGLTVVVGDAIWATDAGVITDVWGKFAVMAYVEVASLASMGNPSYGYTYQLGGYPIVESPYLDRNTKSWVYPVTDEVVPVIAGSTAGYLISAAVA